MTVTAKTQPARALRGAASPPEAVGKTERLDRAEPATSETGGVLVCRVCRSKITRRDLGMEVDGGHGHVFFNPHGLVFEVGCFASAGNVLPTGPRTETFSWFPGYAWQAVACTGCHAHLGWRFTGDGGGFFGLILNALQEEAEPRP